MVIVVLAHALDEAALGLVRRWEAHGSRLFTSADLCRPGWRAGEGPRWDGTAVLDGDRVPIADIGGVVVRTPVIEAAELSGIVPEDRVYCAAEMTAFLTWWLKGLRCRVVNRPSATSLSGPGWHPITWALVARQLGLLPVVYKWDAAVQKRLNNGSPNTRDLLISGSTDLVEVTVIAGSCIGEPPPALARAATALAQAARAEALTVAFDCVDGSIRFLSAEPWVDVSKPAVADALLEFLLRDSPACTKAPW